MSFEFWQRWLLIASVAFATFGIFVALFHFALPFDVFGPDERV